MSQMPQILWILFEMSLQLLTFDKLLSQLLDTRLADSTICNSAQRISETVPESFQFLHIECIWLDLAALLLLLLGDFGQDSFVVFGRWDTGGLVFSVLRSGDDE